MVEASLNSVQPQEPSARKPGSRQPSRGAQSSPAFLDIIQLLHDHCNSCRGPGQTGRVEDLLQL